MTYNEEDLKRAYHLGYAQSTMHIPFMKDDEIISYIGKFHKKDSNVGKTDE